MNKETIKRYYSGCNPGYIERIMAFNRDIGEIKADCSSPILKRAFLFSRLTGLKFSDIEKLQWNEVIHTNEQGHYIKFHQKETKSLPISKRAYNLLGEPKDPLIKVFEGLRYNDVYYCYTIYNRKNILNSELERNQLFDAETKKRLKTENRQWATLQKKIIILYDKACKHENTFGDDLDNVRRPWATSMDLTLSEINQIFSTFGYQKLFIKNFLDNEDYRAAINVQRYLITRLETVITFFNQWHNIDLKQSPLNVYFDYLLEELKNAVDIPTLDLLTRLDEDNTNGQQKKEPQAQPNNNKTYPVFASSIVDKVFGILKEHFNNAEHTALYELLTNGTTPKYKLYFTNNGNKLTDAFKKLIESNLITNCNKVELQHWIFKHFQFRNRRTRKSQDYKLRTIQDDISNKMAKAPCKNPLFDIKNGIIIKA